MFRGNFVYLLSIIEEIWIAYLRSALNVSTMRAKNVFSLTWQQIRLYRETVISSSYLQ